MLFLHGILGTPRHFDFLLPLLPEDWSVWTLMLPGHGGSCADFSRSSMAQWKSSVSDAIEELRRGHRRIFIVTHSMGGLLAVWAASENPEKIAGIFALAMSLKIRFTAKAAMASLHAAFRSPESDSPYRRATRDACSITLSKNPFAYLGWFPRFLELFALSRDTRRMIGDFKLPCLVIQSAKDELVSKRSAEFTGNADTVSLPDSSHYFYSEKDRETILSEFSQFIKQ